MIAIKTINLSKKYKDKLAVDNLNVEIKEGELYSLLGVNGAGKTTTIKMLSLLIKETSGNAFIMGYDIKKDSLKIKEITNVSPQETAVALNLSTKENLDLMCDIYGINKANTQKMIKDFGLTDIENKKAKTLSGGMQRRLSIAMALITSPKVLFLDEPTLGLDVIARRELWNLIKSLKGKVTIVLTTHYLEEVEALSDRVGIMVSGKLVKEGTIEEIINEKGYKNFEDAFVDISLGKVVTK